MKDFPSVNRNSNEPPPRRPAGDRRDGRPGDRVDDRDRRRSSWAGRLLLWGLAALVAVGLFAAGDWARDRVVYETARERLAAGDAAAAADLFSRQLDSPWVGTGAQAGHTIASTLAGDDSGLAGDGRSPELRAGGDFPLRTYARGAFDRGDFAGALRLDALAEDQGLGADPVMRTAALIELGESDRARALWRDEVEQPGERALDHRVASYLSRPDGFDRTVLLDRHGHRLGTVTTGGRLELDEEIPPELVPAMVADLVGEREPRPGVLRLTLDLELSRAAAAALGAYEGSIVLLDPANGQILAAISDPRSAKDGATPAFEQMREPASILKLVTTSATQRAGIDPDAEISQWRCPGHVRLDGEMLYCSSPRGDMESLDHVMAISCNVAFAKLGVEIGREKLVEELRRYGFDSDFGPFPGGNIVVPTGNDRQLGDLSIGLEATEMTPLHAALLAATMDDGVMPMPTLVAATDGRLGLHPAALPAADGRPIIENDAHLRQLQQSMLAVAAEGGTAKNVEPPGMEVAMKTGTASHDRHGYHINYIGLAPMPDPQIAYAIRITGYWSSSRVRGAGSIVTRRLLAELDDHLRQRQRLTAPADRPVPRRLAAADTAPLATAPIDTSAAETATATAVTAR